MPTALFINGVFEATLREIIEAQGAHPDLVCMLQPYSGTRIKLLLEQQPSARTPTTLYLSTTTDLAHVSYRAAIVAWQDKRAMSPAERQDLNRRISLHQPSEGEIYLEVRGTKCVNLIFVALLERLPSPVPVSCFIKVGDQAPLKSRTRAGGFAYVEEQPRWLGMLPTVVEGDLAAELSRQVANAEALSATDRAARLASFPTKPEEVQILTRAFRRNPYVIVEVLRRAAGRCELCESPAPFIRLSDGSPYLEVHHKVTLAAGGDDTVENSLALCPNCHRREHFGRREA